MLGRQGLQGQKAPPMCGIKRERSQSLESTVTEQVLVGIDPSAAEVAKMLFSLKAGARDPTSSADQIAAGPEEVALQLREERSSSSGSASTSSTPMKVACKALTATSSPKLVVPLATRSYVWRGPKRALLNLGNSGCPGHLTSSDLEEEEDCGAAGPAQPASATLPAAAVDSSTAGDRSDRDKEWAALTTWLRMNLHHPRTAKREVLFLGKHVEGRGWQFFLNPALSWNDVSPETKMRLRTLPHETELAFMRKYPAKPGRDWVKKTQKYRPPGCSVTYSVPLADMVYSLTAIYYRFEGRPGTGVSSASRNVAAAAAGPACSLPDAPDGAGPRQLPSPPSSSE